MQDLVYVRGQLVGGQVSQLPRKGPPSSGIVPRPVDKYYRGQISFGEELSVLVLTAVIFFYPIVAGSVLSVF